MHRVLGEDLDRHKFDVLVTWPKIYDEGVE